VFASDDVLVNLLVYVGGQTAVVVGDEQTPKLRINARR
jgi:hypothetical protein